MIKLSIILLVICISYLFIKKYFSYSSMEKYSTPFNIIQTWKTDNIPPKYKQMVDKVKKLHPDANYMFFTDNDIVNFIKTRFPQYLSIYNNFKYKIEKIDFFRYLAIYYYGGLYLDLDMEMHKSFNPTDFLSNECVFPIEFLQNGDFVLQKQHFNKLIGNYAFYAPKNHPFLKLIIDNVVNKRLQKSLSRSPEKYVYYSTGPVLVTQSYIDFSQKTIKLIKPIPFRKEHFGKYAKHKLMGSWK